MGAHAEAVGDRFEFFLFLMNAIATPPPPCLMDKGAVSWIHQADDAVVHAARQVGGKMRNLVLVAERRNTGRRNRRFRRFGET